MSSRLHLLAFVLPLLLVAAHTPPEDAGRQASGAIAGVITLADTGEPVPGASIALVGTPRGAASNIDGEFTIADVPAGDHEVRVAYVGMVAQTLTVTVREGETTPLNVALVVDETIEEVVVGAERAVISRDATGGARTVSGKASGLSSPTSPRMAPARSRAADLATPGMIRDMEP
ncbi:carboxypeptidase-like regulatory domain-containing protein, partial [Rubricoccus marinus]|uniref:carboxypeptidase-like regulatory domain-containing protein n=1 Tax=Rubricoccus marinus TaxID=716817 RepID=UPI00117B8C08